MKTYDVAIHGWWNTENYGSVITYYGLKKFIENQGYSVIMIEDALGLPGRGVVRENSVSRKFSIKEGYEFSEQIDFHELYKMNDLADTFITGSDQLWHPDISRVNDDLFLNYTFDEKKRISYGTSFGNFNWPLARQEFVAIEKQNLRRFDAISVREQSGVELLKSTFDLEAVRVVDPVFLIDSLFYDELAKKAEFDIQGDYLLAFILDPSTEKRQVIENVAKKLGLDKIVVFGDGNARGEDLAQQIFNDDKFIVFIESDSHNWLAGYKNANYVITDSFHGTCFAQIFQKPFSHFFNEKRGANRFKELMTLLQFNDERRIYETDTIETINKNNNISFEINFKKANDALVTYSKKSAEWLIEKLRASKNENKILPSATRYENMSDDEKNNFRSNVLAYLTSKEFVFYRKLEPEKVLASFRFLSDGKILSSQKLYDSVFWKFVDGFIILMNIDHEDKTKLIPVNINGEEWEISGPYLLNAETVHVLEESSKYYVKHKISTAPIENDKAIPHDIPTRKQNIYNILNDKRIKEQQKALEKLFPQLEFFAGRELKDYTHNKVGGPSDLLVFPKTTQEIEELIRWAVSQRIRYTILGNASNVLIRDGGLRGLTIITTSVKSISLQNNLVTVAAGYGLIELSYFLLNKNKTGFEWASNIPGTVGGAVFMNAGTNKSDIRSLVRTIKVIDGLGNVFVLKQEEIPWGKRYSIFQDHMDWVILEATFEVTDNNLAKSVSDMEDEVQARERIFPLELPSHGSTFKWWRHPRLIDQAGLTGYRIGGAKISEKQPGFFVNIDNATASDYEALIDYTIAKVYEFSGFMLEPEVIILGEYPYQLKRYTSLTFKLGD